MSVFEVAFYFTGLNMLPAIFLSNDAVTTDYDHLVQQKYMSMNLLISLRGVERAAVQYTTISALYLALYGFTFQRPPTLPSRICQTY